MKHSFLHKMAALFVIIITGCIPLTSCTSLHPAASSTPSTAAAQNQENMNIDVRKTIDAYFDEVRTGRLMNPGYESMLFAGTNPFNSLVFSDEQTRTAMQAGMDRIKYEITDITMDSIRKSADCAVRITVLDVLEIKAGLAESEDGFYYDSFIKAMEEDDAPMKDYDTKLVLNLSADNKAWIIEDTTSFAAILADPYIGLIFDKKYYKAEIVIDSLMRALAAGDSKTVDMLCSKMDSSAFFPKDELGLILADAIYSCAEYKVSSDPKGTDSAADMAITVTLPDMDANYIDAINDTDMVAQSLKPAIVTVLKGGTDNEGAYAYRKAFYTELASRLTGKDALLISYDIHFSLVFDEEIENWRISSVQTERLLTKTLEGYDPLFDLKEQRLQTAIEKAADELFLAGTIDEQQQSDIKNSFIQVLLPAAEDPSSQSTLAG